MTQSCRRCGLLILLLFVAVAVCVLNAGRVQAKAELPGERLVKTTSHGLSPDRGGDCPALDEAGAGSHMGRK